jgi:Holliday junction resolvase RusA-like endonuclease
MPSKIKTHTNGSAKGQKGRSSKDRSGESPRVRAQTGSIKLTLPLPPSVNQLYAGYPRRYKSEGYKEWLETASLVRTQDKRYFIKGDEWLAVEYRFFIPLYCKNANKRVVDVFNYEKALSDFLSKDIEGFADHKIRTGIVEKVDSSRYEVEVTITELSYNPSR